MDQVRARTLLDQERERLHRLTPAATGGQEEDLDLEGVGDEVDDADRRETEETGMAVDRFVQDRWAALRRAEARLEDGSYGRSVRSGRPIPDERLEADPLAELTVDEAASAEAGAFEPGDEGAGLASEAHPYEVLGDADITPEELAASEEDLDEPPPEPGGRDTGNHLETDDGRG